MAMAGASVLEFMAGENSLQTKVSRYRELPSGSLHRPLVGEDQIQFEELTVPERMVGSVERQSNCRLEAIKSQSLSAWGDCHMVKWSPSA